MDTYMKAKKALNRILHRTAEGDRESLNYYGQIVPELRRLIEAYQHLILTIGALVVLNHFLKCLIVKIK